jgi:hypothetical protein
VHPSQFDYQLPTFGHCPPSIGSLPTYSTANEPNWQLYADIDDTRPVEMKFEIPDILYELYCIEADSLVQSIHKVTGYIFAGVLYDRVELVLNLQALQ